MEDPGPTGDFEHRGWTMPYWNDELAKLKQQAGKSIVIYGSSELVNSLMQHHVIDAYHIMLYLVALRKGRRFFRDGGDQITLTLTSGTTTSTGVAILTYQPAA